MATLSLPLWGEPRKRLYGEIRQIFLQVLPHILVGVGMDRQAVYMCLPR